MPVSEEHDVIIIGGGIVGLATARALIAQNRRPLVLEAESEVGVHQTGHNSGVIHAGLYYAPGSLKATLCARGREEMYRYCAERSIPCTRCGKVVVATSEDELPRLEELERRGQANGLEGLRRLTPDQVRDHEPHAAAIAGLFVPQTGVTDFGAVARAFAADVAARGAVRTGCRARTCGNERGRVVVETDDGALAARLVINCGGLHSDRIAVGAGATPDVRIIPFRGEYDTLSEDGARLVRGLIYPVPDPRFPFLGVHLTRLIDGRVKAGPNAVLSLARHGYRRTNVSLRDVLEIAGYSGWWRLARRYWRTGCAEFLRSLSRRASLRSLQRLVPDLRAEHLRPGPTGVRAMAVDRDGRLVDDFRIVRTGAMVHVLNAPSPAATASLAIGEHIAQLAR
ncbi:MAG: L-2-hydroxyglutarate oxidase [Planctomycetes bacterium]|nr:L-2-hydroxyglutarate oxidase [Planctomycetota bacterium]